MRVCSPKCEYSALCEGMNAEQRTLSFATAICQLIHNNVEAPAVATSWINDNIDRYFAASHGLMTMTTFKNDDPDFNNNSLSSVKQYVLAQLRIHPIHTRI